MQTKYSVTQAGCLGQTLVNKRTTNQNIIFDNSVGTCTFEMCINVRNQKKKTLVKNNGMRVKTEKQTKFAQY